jgi:hypothetical protein
VAGGVSGEAGGQVGGRVAVGLEEAVGPCLLSQVAGSRPPGRPPRILEDSLKSFRSEESSCRKGSRRKTLHDPMETSRDPMETSRDPKNAGNRGETSPGKGSGGHSRPPSVSRSSGNAGNAPGNAPRNSWEVSGRLRTSQVRRSPAGPDTSGVPFLGEVTCRSPAWRADLRTFESASRPAVSL